MQRSGASTALRLAFTFLLIAGFALVLISAGDSQNAPSVADKKQAGFEVSFSPGSRDVNGLFMGGTEVRSLVGHDGKLFAGNGYWMDRPGWEGVMNAQVLVLDRPSGMWRVDHAFKGWMPNGRPRNLAVSVMGDADFTTDANGRPLAKPVALLLASTWDLTGETSVFTRDDADGGWASAPLAYTERIPGQRRLAQVRSFGRHRDRTTGVDTIFAGEDPNGIYSGAYDPAVPGRIRWGQSPELDISGIAVSGFPGMENHLRVTSFAEADEHLYAAVGQQIYERIDGTTPRWRAIYTNPSPGFSRSGLRGLTAVPNPGGDGEVLLAAVEGTASRIVRVNPRDGSEATDLQLGDFLSKAWGMRVAYVIAAYNDMAKIHDLQGNDVLLIGLDASIGPESAAMTGHSIVNMAPARHEGDAWYLIRRPNGAYDLHRISPRTGFAMIATRSIAASPFPGDGDGIYFAGFDANFTSVHNTGWIVRSTISAAIGGQP
jgi:poly(A) polymerase